MPDNAWILVVLLVGWLRFGLNKEAAAINGVGGMIFAFLSFAAALWVIFSKLA